MAEQKNVINRLANFVQTNIDKLYQSTYYSQPNNLKDLTNIQSDIDKSIDDIITNNINNTGMPNISKLYSRVFNSQNKDDSMYNEMKDIFEDKTMMDGMLSTYLDTKYLKDLDEEIDIICKYMPKLLEALDTRKDNVLCSDHFSKDFINISNDSNINQDSSFSKKIATLKTKYNLSELFDTAYDNAAKYGEEFIYILPYKKALSKLLADKEKTISGIVKSENGTIVMEGYDPIHLNNTPDNFNESGLNFSIEIDQSNMISSIVKEATIARKKYTKINEQSLIYSFKEAVEADKTNTDYSKSRKNFDKTINDDELNFSAFNDRDSTTIDGLINPENDKKTEVDIPGCIAKRLERVNVKPIYIEDLCLGYYYIEVDELTDLNFNSSLSDPMTYMKQSNITNTALKDDKTKDKMLNYIAGELSKFIDAKFINANQDLRKELYMILKHNDTFNNSTSSTRVKVSFIPPEDMVHIYFKKDPKTHRGISDLHKALFPAKIYAALYITNSIAVMTRGQDKRVYYVKTQVETNIAKTLLNTIDQIKKSNFNIRQIENINQVLNITGRFNDYVIPQNAAGESPVQFEVMPGQDINPQTDLMDMLEEMAINSTDVPLELIQARQSMDYAIQYSMSNSKFLRKIYNRQAKYQIFCSAIVTRIYNYEYDEDEELSMILPAPMFLNITNTNQIINNTNEFVNSIVEIEMADEPDDMVKAIFTKRLKRHYLNTYLDTHNIEAIAQASRQEAMLKATGEE